MKIKFRKSLSAVIIALPVLYQLYIEKGLTEFLWFMYGLALLFWFFKEINDFLDKPHNSDEKEKI